MSRPPSPSQSIRDPTERWEQIRAEWLSTSSSSSSDLVPRKPKDAVFSQRIKTLEELLRSANAGDTASPPASSSSFGRAGSDAVPNLIETETASLSLDPKGKARETEPELEELPDDGFAVGGERRGSTQELKKISEGIFLAFKQGRALKEALPLSLVTSLLFRSWLIDGTIPVNYCRSQAEPDPEMPRPLAPPIPPHVLAEAGAGGGGGTTDEARASSPSPSPLALLSEMNPLAVTPMPSESDEVPRERGDGRSGTEEGGNGSLRGTAQPDVRSDVNGDGETGAMPPPHGRFVRTATTAAPKAPGINPLQRPAAGSSSTTSQASLEGMGADETSGKLKLDVLRGSRWRTERDVASGSDII
ncbi:hypothetical protein JCM3766R1_001340 [Sporobolomyces carnicolor]